MRAANDSLWGRRQLCWYLYDFANSVLSINVTVYFSQWIVIDKHVPDLVFAIPFMIATALLMLASPYVGALGDKKGSHASQLTWLTCLGLASAVLMWFAGKYLPDALAVPLALVGYLLYQFFVQLALVPYTAFVKSISSPRTYGRLSGWGFAWSEAGHIAGLLITLPLLAASGSAQMDRLSVILPAAAVFLLLALPSFLMLRNVKIKKSFTRPSIWKSTWRNIQAAKKYPGVLPLLVAFYFFSDALMSIGLFSAIYLEKVLHVPDDQKVILFMMVLGGMFFGGVIGGWLSDKVGHLRVLLVGLFFTICAIVAAGLSTQLWHIRFAFPLFGVFSGIVYASSRSYLATLIPTNKSGTFYGLYALSERFASIIGPLVWGAAVWIFADIAPWNYRIAVLAMAVLAACGFLPFLFMRKASRA